MNKNKREKMVDDHGTWMISYGDMITLLLAFFVLFFTVNPEEDKVERLNRSLMTELAEIKRDPSSSEIKTQSMAIGETEGEEGISSKIIKEWGAEVHSLGQRIILEFPGVSFFDLGEVKPTEEGIDVLKRFVKVYEPYQGHYVLGIRAFTDQKKVRANGRRYKDNLELSALRAVATMRELQELGVPLRYMRLGGYGELIISERELQKVRKLNKDATAFDLARRVVLVIEPVTEEQEKLVEGEDNA